MSSNTKLGDFLRQFGKQMGQDASELAAVADKVVKDLGIEDMVDNFVNSMNNPGAGFGASTSQPAGTTTLTNQDGHVSLTLDNRIKSLKVNGKAVDIPPKVQ